MKKPIILAIVFALTCLTTTGKDYYVRSNVTHSGKGTETAPFKTIQEAALIMKPGDHCYIGEGVYPETIKPSNSGTPGAPITFQPWHQNDKVQITGLNSINLEDWISDGKNRYMTKIKLELGHENQVFRDGRMLHLACWPNQGEDFLSPALSEMEEGTTPGLIIDSSLPDYDFTNANVWVHAPKYWSNWTTEVIAYTKGRLQIKNNAPFPGPSQHVATKKAQYYAFGILDALDSENEWFYQEKNEILYLFRGTNTTSLGNISYKKRLDAFILNDKSYVTIRNLEIRGASIKTNINSNHILLDGLRILYPYHSSQANNTYGNQLSKGIQLIGKNCTLQNSEIAFSSGSGVVLDGEYNKVINCYIHDTDYIGTYASCVQLGGKGNMVSHCTLTRSGRSVIDYSGMYQALIQYNDLSHSGLLTSDLGITYGNIIEGGNSEIRYNWLHDNDDTHLDMGLYFDHGTQNIISHHNVIWGIDHVGLIINHYGYFHLVYNNTFVSQQSGFRSKWGNKYGPDLYGCRFSNNIFSGPAETTADNYVWSHNMTDYKEMRENRYLKSNSVAIDRGIPIKGITTNFVGSFPDVGAYEYNGRNWVPGHNFEKFPEVDTIRTNPAHRNMLANSAFEHEDHLFPWEKGKGEVSIVKGTKGQTTPDTASVRMGRWSVKLGQGAEISQTVTGLASDTWYEFSGFLKVEKDGNGFLGVYDNDSNLEHHSVSISGNEPKWNRGVVRFKTGLKGTGVKVYVKNDSRSEKEIFADDLGLIMVE